MEWRRDASEIRTIWPYCVKDNIIKLQADARLMNGGVPSGELLQDSNWLPGQADKLVNKRSVLDIYSSGEPWTEVAVQCELSVDDPGSLKSEVLPPGEDVPLTFALLVRCDKTRWRASVTSPFGEGKASLSFTLTRSEVAGEVEIQPLVILASPTTSVISTLAHRKAARVATGFPLYVHADESLEGPGRGIEVQWAEFGDPIESALYRLEIVEDKKVRLYLNARYPALDPIFKSRSRVRNEKTILRDALFSFIATDVWLQLGDIAAYEASQTGQEEGEQLPPLYDNVLKFLSRKLGLDRELITSYFAVESDGLKRAEFQQRLQDYLTLAGKTESIVLASPGISVGGS